MQHASLPVWACAPTSLLPTATRTVSLASVAPLFALLMLAFLLSPLAPLLPLLPRKVPRCRSRCSSVVAAAAQREFIVAVVNHVRDWPPLPQPTPD